MTRITFQQTADSFHVEEKLFYEPSGTGPYVFVKIRKKNCSTPWVERRMSEWTGVPLKHIRHAGMKDSQATSIQWLSWPECYQKNPLETTNGQDDLEVLQLSRHENTLATGHIKANSFTLILSYEGQQINWPTWSSLFPNFYGGQRFGSDFQNSDKAIRELKKSGKKRFAISQLQSLLFNVWLRERLQTEGLTAREDDLWTTANGKRFFEAPLDKTLLARFKTGEAVPTGPIFGYKNKHTNRELQFLEKYDLEPESFRKWGKIARGTRRPLFIKPEIHKAQQDKEIFHLHFSLPSGSYATIFLLNAFRPGDLLQDNPDVNFTQQTLLREES